MPVRASVKRCLQAAALAWLAQACSEDSKDPADQPPAVPPVMQPGVVGAQPPGGTSGTPVVPGTGAAGAPSVPQAGAPALPTDPGAMQMPPSTMTPPATEPAPDPCKDFVVSRRAPCSNDPNPCNIDSGYPGDEYCLPPPKPEEGIQVHFGPKDYKNTAEVAKYLLEPTQEFNDYGLANIPTTDEKFYNRVVYHMRPGSHHLINSIVSGHPTEGFMPKGQGCDGSRVGTLGGTQNLIYDSRPNGIVPPENEGVGYVLPGMASICFNFHRYNTTDADQLSEIWVNFYFVDEAEVTQRARWGAIIGGLGMSIRPGEEKTLTYSSTFSGVTSTPESPARIIQLFGHRHAATYRFSAWLNDTMIYDSWDWQESVTFNYDSLTDNPKIQPNGMIDAGHSGVLAVKNGDVLKYSCYIRNETDVTLTFANELYTAEMCNLFGQSVGASFNGLFF